MLLDIIILFSISKLGVCEKDFALILETKDCMEKALTRLLYCFKMYEHELQLAQSIQLAHSSKNTPQELHEVLLFTSP